MTVDHYKGLCLNYSKDHKYCNDCTRKSYCLDKKERDEMVKMDYDKLGSLTDKDAKSLLEFSRNLKKKHGW